MQLTDWLVVVFIVAIVVVMLDGVRRKLQERRNRVVLKIDRNLAGEDFDEAILSSAELPNGGARTLPRAGQPAPTLRNLKTSRKSASQSHTRERGHSDSDGTVPVLMDAVELEEEHIEHTNVFADSGAGTSFEADDFNGFRDDSPVSGQQSADPASEDWDADDIDDEDWSNAADDRDEGEDDEDAEGVEEDYEEDAPMLREEPVARSRQASGLDARYQGTEDDDDYEDDEELADDEYEEDDVEEELIVPAELDEDDEDDEEDLDDDFDEDDEDEAEEDELEDEDDELDELGSFPEDDWGIEEEQDQLVDDYENEPVLLQDTYNKAASHFSRNSHPPRIEPGFGDGDTFDEEALEEDFGAATDEADAGHSETFETMKPLPGTRRSAPEPAPAASPAAAPAPPARADAVAGKPQPPRQDQRELFREESRVRTAPDKPPAAKPQAAPDPEPEDAGPQEVIIINVMARPGHMLKGGELLPILQQQGLRLGDMSIFHRHTDPRGSGPVVFSMANMVKPGTFDLGSMETFTTPGVSLFLQMPNRIGNMAAFDMMLGTATALRNGLDAELKDENRSVFTRQTVEHSRQRVSDFELALLSHK